MTEGPVSRRTMIRLSTLAAAGSITLPHETLFATTMPGPLRPEIPADSRLGKLKDLNGYFPFSPPATIEEWNTRREYVIRQMLVACGLWPMPERPPITATVHGRVERDDYTVDRVYFESSPGLLVTGSLYLPRNYSGKLPAVLCPHGHWANGRFYDHGEAELKRQLESGGEKFETGGRYPLQARSVQLARMGCMVFLYDMLGYADGSSLSQDLTHGFSRQRPHLSSPDHWGLFSAQSELRCLNAMGIQTWNSLRALDWIMSRPDCDTGRIGVTGASGGGTQTFILTALDERVTAAFPAVMVSTAMQGGCTCENASYLRVNTGNIEFAALAAPRPIAMTGADDWTVEIETKGLPELKQHYALLGAPDNVAAKYMKFPHNYNHPSRMMMYEFFNRTLNLGATTIEERDFVPLSREEATVFGEGHPAPSHSEEAEVKLISSLAASAERRIADLTPTDADSLKTYRHVVGGALDVMIGRRLPPPGSTEFQKATEVTRDGFLDFTGHLLLKHQGESLPTTFLLPSAWNHEVVLWFDGIGKSGVFTSGGQPVAEVTRLLRAGFAVGTVDLYLTGEFTEDGKPVSQMPVVSNPREFAGYTLGYNHPLFSQRVHDVLTAVSHAMSHDERPTKIHLAGLNGAGPVVAAAAAIIGGAVASVAVDTQGFRFRNITNIRDVNLLPGAVKYGDVPALLALCSPTRLGVIGETADSASVTAAAYSASKGSIRFLSDSAHPAASLVTWLLEA